VEISYGSASVVGSKLIFTDLPKSATVSDTLADSQQAGHILDTYSCSLFADPWHIQAYREIWEIGPKRLVKKHASTKIYLRMGLHKKMQHFQGHCLMTMRQVLVDQI
jgi:hypothetical protein